MRIFTLGKNGIPLFFFALFLFSGTYSSYGQCPTVSEEDAIQYFCDSQEAEISDLTVTTGTDVVWYESQTATTSLPETQFLVSGTTYYAGQADNSCINNRAAVTVRIASEPEILGIRASTTPTASAERKQSLAVIGVCVADVNDPNLFIEDLRTSAENEENIRWYYSRTATEPIAPGTELQNNTDYFAALYSPEGDCETNRRKTTVRFFSEPAPTGPAQQSFCAADEPTLADIEASGENRYFSTATSQTELSENTPLVDGRTYYISAIGENCESVERLAVTVMFDEANAGEDNLTAQICLSDLQARLDSGETPREIFLSLLDEGVPTNGSFSPTIEELAAQYNQNPVGTFATTYTVTTATGCEDSADLALTTLEDPNAGENQTLEFCQSEIEELAAAYFANPDAGRAMLIEMLGDVDQNGTFSNQTLETIVQNYSVAVQANQFPFQAQTTYTVTNAAGCEDSSTINLIVYDSPYAGDDTTIEVAPTDDPVDLFAVLVANSSSTPDSGGTWSPGNGTFSPSTDAPGDFVYTVTNDNGCTDSATVTVTTGEDTQPVNQVNVQVCSADINNPTLNGFRDFYKNQVITKTDLPTGGTFDNFTIEELYNQYQNDPIGTFTTTYTVNTENGEESVVISVQVIQSQPAEAGTIADMSVSENEGVVVLDDSILSNDATMGGTFTSAEGVLNNEGNFDPSVVGPGVYSITYTVNSSMPCVTGEDSETFTITVTEETQPVNQVNVQVCSADINNPTPNGFRTFFQNQVTLKTNLPLGGTFNPTTLELYNQYQNDPIGTFTTTYTVNTANGEESVVISVQVIQSQTAEAGTIADMSVSENEGVVVLDDNILSNDATMGGTFTSAEALLNNEGNFDPSVVGPGVYSITYTVNSSMPCVTGEDSETFTITVTEEQEQNRIFVQVCTADIDNPTLSGFQNFYRNQLTLNNIPTGGTFSPTLADLYAEFQNDPIGTFTTTYTVNTAEGELNVEVSVQVIETQTAEAGEIADLTVACGADVIILDDSVLSENASRGGRFTAEEGVLNAEGNFDPAIGAGVYTITYTVDSSALCVEGTDSTSFTITVTEGTVEYDPIAVSLCSIEIDNATVEGFRNYFRNIIFRSTNLPSGGTFTPTMEELLAQYEDNPLSTFTTTYTVNTTCGEASVQISVTALQSPDAGEDATVDLEGSTTETIDLFAALGGNPETGGVWTDASGATVDATFDPTTEIEGVFTYTVTSDNGCTDSATVTVVVGEEPVDCAINAPAAPAVEDFNGCVVTGATVADLDITAAEGNTVTVYSDAEFQNPVADTDVLVEGNYYVTQTNADGCESEAAVITVTLADTNAPTLTQGGNIFCEFDNPTIADLEENITATGDVVWYTSATGTETLNPADELENGVTYYAAAIDETSGCESSERLAVNVTLESCPIIIPDAFSPNGDGINDRFVIENIADEYPDYRLLIYNRWGEPVYEGNASTPAWDGVSTKGSFGSGVLPAGVYFYILYYNDGQTAPTQGRLYLSR